MKKTPVRKPLRLDVHTVRALSSNQLAAAVGAGAPTASCQPKYSCTGGCGDQA